MTDKLPPNLLALFAARPPLRWVEPPDYAPEKRTTATIGSVASFLPALQHYKATDQYTPTESWLEARDRKKREKKEFTEKLAKEAPKIYKPNEDPNIRGDSFKTLIVARLSYEADERDLEREFGRFGPIERIRIITDTHAHEKPNKKKKPHRGYAFVVFEREKDMRGKLSPSIPVKYHLECISAISNTPEMWPSGLPFSRRVQRDTKGPQACPSLPIICFTGLVKNKVPHDDSCDGIRIKDRRIKLDVERGRTVTGWLPRRLGGGRGGRGYTKAMPPRPAGPGAFGGGGGGFRGGFKGFEGGRGRGGFRGGRGDGFRRGGDFGPRGGDRNGYGAPSGAPPGPGGFDRRGGGDRGFSDHPAGGTGETVDETADETVAGTVDEMADATVTAKAVVLGATWSPSAGGKVGIETVTVIATEISTGPAMTTIANVAMMAATKIPESCVGTELSTTSFRWVVSFLTFISMFLFPLGKGKPRPKDLPHPATRRLSGADMILPWYHKTASEKSVVAIIISANRYSRSLSNPPEMLQEQP
ncbi:U1 small nuclear ribonucleoprotein 70 kDa [Paramyrothecium foliicola]|nr:U1 small nuclear ribonucleoprotein 70 kDa [Paramyrothecium foliicola]